MSPKLPLKHKLKFIVFFNNRKIIFLQSTEDAMDSQFTLLKQHQDFMTFNIILKLDNPHCFQVYIIIL